MYEAYKLQLLLIDRKADCWSAKIKLILYEYGFGHVWLSQGVDNDQHFISIFQTRIRDIQFQKLCSTIIYYPKLECYKEFKTLLSPEKYLNLQRFCDRRSIARCHISNHNLDVEARRFRNRVYRPMRVCRNCNTGKAQNEIYLLLICPAYKEIRKQLISGKLSLNRNQISFNKLTNTHNIDYLRNLANFL